MRRFLSEMSPKVRQKALAAIDLLEEEGPGLRRPHADNLGGGIHELRVRVSTLQYRILYFFYNRRDIVLTHGFRKTRAKVPPAEMRRALRCREDWLERHGQDA